MNKAPCVPSYLPPEGVDWSALTSLLGAASLELGRYDGLLDGMGNESILLSPLTTNEAVLSSRIEGTQASLSEVLHHEAGGKFDEYKQGDIFEILNYRKALVLGEDSVRENPISLFLIRQLHEVLLENVRGKNWNPGSFRLEQNWIGKPGCTIEQARFVPPTPLVMTEYLDQWETFAKGDYIDPLLQAGLLHAQFEIIHPFNDGNGRIGRMLVPLYLHQKGVLKRPTFYLSEYLEEHRDLYYDLLLSITED
jgi:Fic family protein